MTVTGEAPIVEVTKSDVSGVITQDQMQNLPLATRQPMDLALLMPGTSQDAVRARKANSNIGAGAFTNGSALLVDGVWNKEGNTGEPRQDFPQSAIQEFKVYLSQSPAEYGWTAGGAVSMATKSGTNQLHGEGFEFYRNKALNTIDPFAKAAGQAKPDFSRHQFGGAIGGPIIKDKVHFFEAAEAPEEQPVRQRRRAAAAVLRKPERRVPESRIQPHVVHARRLADQPEAEPVRALRVAGVGLHVRGMRGVLVQPVVLGRRRHQAAALLVGRRAHVGAVPARAERSARPVDQLSVPRARARASSRRRSCTTNRRRAPRSTDADLHVPEPDRGARTPISTATWSRGSFATTCRSRPASTPGSSAPAARACRSGSPSARRRARGRSRPISRSIPTNLSSFVPVAGIGDAVHGGAR